MLKIQRSSKEVGVVFTLVGRIEIEHIAELQRLLSQEDAGRCVYLDLREVTLVDRDSVRFLAHCEGESVRLENCPTYIRAWINREKETEP